VLFFLPAFFTQSQDIDTSYRSSTPIPHIQAAPLRRPSFASEKRRLAEDVEQGGSRGNSSSPEPNHRIPHRPPFDNRSSAYTSTGTLIDVDIGHTSSGSRT
jgi:hypothetical protein